MTLYILHNVRGHCFYTLWYLLVIGICVIVVPSAEPERPTDIRSLRSASSTDIIDYFLTRRDSYFSLALRGLLLCDTLKQRQPAAHERQEAVRFRRITPYGAWTRQPARPHVQPPVPKKALESLPRCSFPDRMCANQQPRRRTGAVFIWPPERSLERGACV